MILIPRKKKRIEKGKKVMTLILTLEDNRTNYLSVHYDSSNSQYNLRQCRFGLM